MRSNRLCALARSAGSGSPGWPFPKRSSSCSSVCCASASIRLTAVSQYRSRSLSFWCVAERLVLALANILVPSMATLPSFTRGVLHVLGSTHTFCTDLLVELRGPQSVSCFHSFIEKDLNVARGLG